MLSTNERSTEGGSVDAKSRCYWKIVTERLVKPQMFAGNAVGLMNRA